MIELDSFCWAISLRATGVTTVTGVIYAPRQNSPQSSMRCVRCKTRIYDRLYVLHRVDTKPPEGLDIGSPNPYAMAAPITIEGTVRDASSVPMTTFRSVTREPDRRRPDCPDATPDDGA